jgi:hypothetical protein
MLKFLCGFLLGLGYLLNAIVIVGLFLLAYSKKIHSWTINTGVNIVAKLKLIRNPEEKRKKLMLSTENFRIELRRLQSNIPASLLIMFLFVVRFFLLYSIPYFVIVMLDPSFTTQPIYLQTVVSNSFLQMVTGLFPLPGAAGFTEYFFERLFLPILGGSDNIAFVKAVQIVWRLSTFYVGLVCRWTRCGLLSQLNGKNARRRTTTNICRSSNRDTCNSYCYIRYCIYNKFAFSDRN